MIRLFRSKMSVGQIIKNSWRANNTTFHCGCNI